MEPKTYGLKTLARICTAKTGPLDDAKALEAIQDELRGRYIVKADGLWLAPSDKAIGTAPADEAVLHWAPIQCDEPPLPALPIPFTVTEFSAFTLAGCGSLVGERFDGDDGTLDEEALTGLGGWGNEAREVLREAERLKLEAYRQQRIEDGRGEHKQPRDASAAADWLLNAGRNAAADRVGTPPLEQPTQSHELERQAAPAKGGPAAATEAAEVPPAAPAPRVHKLRNRRHVLTAFVDLGRAMSSDKGDYLTVWPALVQLAQQKERPAEVVGYVEGTGKETGIQYRSDSGEVGIKYFSKAALKSWFARERNRLA